MNMAKRFSLFGALLLWIGLIPLSLAFAGNPILSLVGVILLLGWFIVFKRCQDLNLMFVIVKKNSTAWASSSTAIGAGLSMIWVLWHATDEKAVLWAWVIVATTATLRMLIEVDSKVIGERS